MDETIYRRFCEIAGSACVLVDEPMKRHTTFRIGGPADLFCLSGFEGETPSGAGAVPGRGPSLVYIGEWQ